MKIVSIKEAKEKNLKFYFTGIPCKRGHIEQRKTSDRICIKCSVISSLKYQKRVNYKDIIKKRRLNETDHQRLKRLEKRKKSRDKYFARLNNDPIKKKEYLSKKRQLAQTKKSKDTRKLWSQKNKDTINANKRNWLKNLDEEMKKKQLLSSYKWKLNNKEKAKKLTEEWNLRLTASQKTKLRIKKNLRIKNRKKIDPNFKLIETLRSQLYKKLKAQNSIKKNKSVELLGIELNKFKLFIEKKFEEGMTWSNHGKTWHLDHIIPVSIIDLSKEDNLRFAFNYKNYQPLFVKDNLIKHNKVFIELKDGMKKNDIDFAIKNILQRCNPNQELEINFIKNKKFKGFEITFKNFK
jgi:hypothetical protein